ncbi:MAG TPA: CBM20 domain-containing protein [Candidatus Eremiobacteraceae bacterium]
MFRRLATIAIAVAACGAGLFSTAASSEAGQGVDANTPASAVVGVFVSLGTDTAGTLITIDRAGSLTSLRVAATATVSEDETGAAPRPGSLASLKPGEPVELQLAADGGVASVVARYALVATRVIATQNGYVVTADGNAYKLIGAALAAAPSLETGTYVLMRTDPVTGGAFDVTASSVPFHSATAPGTVVAVTFIVLVPPNTPPGDAIYLATNSGSWTPNGTRLAPLSGGRWSATLQLAAGTQIEYRYTRGSWTTDERTAAGTPTPNRTVTVSKTPGAQAIDDVVARWADLAS